MERLEKRPSSRSARSRSGSTKTPQGTTKRAKGRPSGGQNGVGRQKLIDAARFDTGTEKIELPVKLKVHDSIFVPLAKWAMLLAGNYRCVQKDGMRSIKDAVHSDLEASRAVYDWVKKLCVSLGAAERDLVPFEKYANAALSLLTPSSAARALAAGAPNIERVDRLVQTIARQKDMRLPAIDETVALVDGWVESNRKKAAAR